MASQNVLLLIQILITMNQVKILIYYDSFKFIWYKT